MHDVSIVKATGDRQLTSGCTWSRLNADEQPVGRVVLQSIAVNIGSDATVVRSERNRLEGGGSEGGFFEAVRVGGHRRIFAAGDRVVIDAGTSLHHGDRIDNLVH